MAFNLLGFNTITSECDDSWYGDTCEHSCNQCKEVDGRNCHRQTGVCAGKYIDYLDLNNNYIFLQEFLFRLFSVFLKLL